MAATAVNGNSDARGRAGNLWGHGDFFVERFDFVPSDFEANERAFRSATLGFGGESVAANEAFFLQIDQFAEADFGGRVTLRIDESLFARKVVHFDKNESGFDTRDIERDHSGGMNVEGLSLVHEFVPDFHGVVPRAPDFVAEIAGVAGARNIHGNAGYFSVRDTKIFEIGNACFGNGMKKFAGCGALQRERGDFFGDVFDFDVEAERVLLKPAKAGIGGGPTVVIFTKAGDRPVVDDIAFRVAPAAVDDLVHGDFVDIPRDDAVDETRGVGAGDAIFVKRRDVNERGGVADGVVLVLVMHFVDADGVIARPLAIVEAFAEGESAFVKCGSDGQGKLLVKCVVEL